MINITIDKNGKPSPDTINVGNQWENRDEELVFSLPEEFKDFNKYVIAYIKNRKTKKEIRQIFPITNDTFVVSSGVTRYAGSWHLYTLCKENPLDLDSDTVDIRAKNGERISISDSINANISPNDIGDDSFQNFPMDENIKLIYDELFALKLEFEKAETAREENELARKHEEELRIQAENARVQAESQRTTAEQSRADNEQLRVNAENERVTAETAREENELARKHEEELRVQSENARVQAEAYRVENETSRLNAEVTRASAEVARANAESTRVSNETARHEAEAQREQAEEARASAETTRSENEQERVNAESERTQYESLRRQSEGIRLANEEARSNAEKTRIQSEHERSNAEAERTSAETARVSAESAREQAEQSRISAESQRVTAEATRESAETARVEAESLRVTAENERVTAENLREEAESKRDGVINDLRNSVDSKITKFYATNNGDTHIIDSDNGKIQDMHIYGKYEQDGTPTIENPIDIKSVVNPTMKVFGANILRLNDLKESTFAQNGITFSSKRGVIKAKGTATVNGIISTDNTGVNRLLNPLTLKSGKTYIFNPNPTKGTESYDCYIDFTNSRNLGLSYVNNNVDTPKKITDEQAEYPFVINLVFKKGTEIDMEWKPQVLQNEALIPYKPYTEQTITLPYTLNAVPVSSGGNVTIDGKQYIADYIDVERGKLVRKVNNKKLKGLSFRYEKTPNNKSDTFICELDSAEEGTIYGYSLCKYMHFEGIVYDIEMSSDARCYVWKQALTIQFKESVGIDSIDKFTRWIETNSDISILYVLATPNEIDLTAEQVQKLKALKTYYPTTNISVGSEQLEGYTVFNYPISMANGWNYVKQQLNDNRDYIYDMDLQSAESYVNSEYAVVLTELGV